ncbi:hypothetical protein BJ170DRAFT_488484 [Xylariales sp. AK1849]|nr:hypothetical protein BJ170DRAFT_488484 [Xylariales sp. AK1849]
MPGSPHPNARRKRPSSPHPEAERIKKSLGQSRVVDSLDASPIESPTRPPEAANNEAIPELSFIPAMFVAAKFDYTQPLPELPLNTSARLDIQMAELDAHTQAVKRNIAWLAEREARRIHAEAVKEELDLTSQGLPPPRSKRLGPTAKDESILIAKMAGEVRPSMDYEAPLDFGYNSFEALPIDKRDTPREAATTRMLGLIKYGMQNLDSYEIHVQNDANGPRRARIAREVAEELARTMAAEGSGGGGDRMDIS